MLFNSLGAVLNAGAGVQAEGPKLKSMRFPPPTPSWFEAQNGQPLTYIRATSSPAQLGKQNSARGQLGKQSWAGLLVKQKNWAFMGV